MNIFFLAILSWIFFLGVLLLITSPLLGILLCAGSVWVAVKLDL